MAGERWVVSLTPFEALKAPEIRQASPSGERRDYEKYSAEASAATRTSCEATRGGGGFEATKVSLSGHHFDQANALGNMMSRSRRAQLTTILSRKAAVSQSGNEGDQI